MTKLLFFMLSLLLCSCASTQKMHFAEFTPVDFRVTDLSRSLGISEKVAIGTVNGGDYSKVGEFADYSWHGFIEGFYEGFVALPYDDPNKQVKLWITDLLEKNSLLSRENTYSKINIYVKRIKLKTQKDNFGYDYRACLVELGIKAVNSKKNIISDVVIEGLAKLHGSDLIVLDKKLFRAKVAFSPDDPPVCMLAIVNALNSNPKVPNRPVER